MPVAASITGNPVLTGGVPVPASMVMPVERLDDVVISSPCGVRAGCCNRIPRSRNNDARIGRLHVFVADAVPRKDAGR